MPYKEEAENVVSSKYGCKNNSNFSSRRKVFKKFVEETPSKLNKEKSFKFNTSFQESSNKSFKKSKFRGSSTPDDLLAKLKKENFRKVSAKIDKGQYNQIENNQLGNVQNDIQAIVQNHNNQQNLSVQNLSTQNEIQTTVQNHNNQQNLAVQSSVFNDSQIIQYFDRSQYSGDQISIGDPVKPINGNISPFSGVLKFTHENIKGNILFSTSSYQDIYVLYFNAPIIYLNGVMVEYNVDARFKINGSVAVTTDNIYVMLSINDTTYFYLFTKNFISLGKTQINKNSQEGYILAYNNNCYYYQAGKLYNLMMNSSFKKLIEDDSTNVSITSEGAITTWNSKKVNFYQQTSKIVNSYDTPYNIIYACNKMGYNFLVLDVNSPSYPIKITWMDEVFNINSRSILLLKIDTKIVLKNIIPYYEVNNVGWFEDLLFLQNTTGLKFYNQNFNLTDFYPYYVSTLVKTTYNNGEKMGIVYNGNVVYGTITSYTNGYLSSLSTYPESCGIVVSLGSQIGVSFVGFVPNLYPELENNNKYYISKGGVISNSEYDHKYIYQTPSGSYITYNL